MPTHLPMADDPRCRLGSNRYPPGRADSARQAAPRRRKLSEGGVGIFQAARLLLRPIPPLVFNLRLIQFK